MATLVASDEPGMSGGEVDRRVAEREAADRAYNDALTRTDRALPRPAEPLAAAEPIALDSRSISDRAGILPSEPPERDGWRGRLAQFVWRLVAPVFTRQQEFNAAAANQLEQTAEALRRLSAALPDARAAQRDELQAFATFNSVLVQYLQQITPFIDTRVRVVDASLEEVRMAAVAAQRAAVAARRDVERLAAAGTPNESSSAIGRSDASGSAAAPSAPASRSLGAGYVGFEDIFRGTSDEIKARQADYVDRFSGATDVLDIGCGRGEFLELLRERGISASGIDANAEMVDVTRARGLQASHADALTYLAALPDDSLGGLVALQVVEHLEPEYLVRLLEAAHTKLRPGATVILETINAACWVAYFESYIRDITHVRPLHPDTLKFLVVAAGFERVDVHFRSPIADNGRLQRVQIEGLPAPIADVARTLNANVDRLNERMFTSLDYAVIGAKGR